MVLSLSRIFLFAGNQWRRNMFQISAYVLKLCFPVYICENADAVSQKAEMPVALRSAQIIGC